MRKYRKPNQEDPAAVGLTQEQEHKPVKETPLSLGNEMFMAADNDKGYNALPPPSKNKVLKIKSKHLLCWNANIIALYLPYLCCISCRQTSTINQCLNYIKKRTSTLKQNLAYHAPTVFEHR